MRPVDLVKSAAAAPRATAVGFWRGLRYPFRGLKFVFVSRPGLIRFWGPPILLTLGALSGALWAGWRWHGPLVDHLWPTPAGATALAAAERLLHKLVEILTLIFLWTVGAVGAALLASLLAAPFNDLLSEEVERVQTGRAGPPFSLGAALRDVARSLLMEGVKLSLYVAAMIPLLLFALAVPVLGEAVLSIAGASFTAAWFALDYLDWPASRRGHGIGWRIGLLRKHTLSMLGFGAGVWLFLFIPFVNLLFMPAAVAGGTLLFLDLEGERAEG